MSSHRKRRAESEDVSHKKPRNGDNDDFNISEDDDGTGSEFGDDEIGAIDSKNIISAGRRVDDTLATNIEVPKIADRVDDDGSENEEGRKGKEKSRTVSSEDEGEEGGNEEDQDEQDEDVTSEDDSEDEYEE